MSKIITIPAGTPNDENRDYLPLAIKGSDMVVNENGNNSQPYPELLKEYHGVICDGKEDTWYEYVPSTYDPSKKTPLVVSLHGGMMTGWGQCIYTSWSLVAEREGIIVVFPDSSNGPFWMVEWDPAKFKRGLEPGLHPTPESPEKNHDIQYMTGIIELMKSKYNIDEGRIYMQGMSMGNMMTATYTRHHAPILAGAAGSGANSGYGLLFDENGKNLNEAGHVAAWLTRPELNGFDGDETSNKYNLRYWLEVNGCKGLPQISVIGEDNFAFYTGEKADTVYLDIKNRDHGQAFDDAELVWSYLFSGVRREADGTITRIGSNVERKGDDVSIAISKDCGKAWLNGEIVDLGGSTILWQKLKYHGLDGGEKVRGEYLCVPLTFVAKAFGANLEVSEDTLNATLTLPNGSTCSFSRGSIGCVYNNRVEAMLCEALHRNGELYIPFEWFACRVMNLHISQCDGVLYATDHWNILSANLASLITDYLK